MYDADDRYWKRKRRFDSCQRQYDNMTPDDEQFDREYDARKDEHKRRREMHRKGVRDEYDENY